MPNGVLASGRLTQVWRFVCLQPSSCRPNSQPLEGWADVTRLHVRHTQEQSRNKQHNNTKPEDGTPKPGTKKNTKITWNTHGTSMEHSWKIHGKPCKTDGQLLKTNKGLGKSNHTHGKPLTTYVKPMKTHEKAHRNPMDP